MTIHDALLGGAEKIGQRDAKLFLSHITGYGEGGLHIKAFDSLCDDECELFFSFVQRRETGEPLQYIIGQWEFMGLPLFTDPRALIPRPETELLVEEALAFIAAKIADKKNPARVLDLCTGSGCIAIAIACLSDAKITAADISDDALSLAKKNACKLKITNEQIIFVKSDLLDDICGEFDVIISNPPYILSGDMKTLSPTVRDHEPSLALDGGVDGLDFYRRLIPQAKKALCKGGALFLEIGPVAVTDLMANAGFEKINLQRDYAEIPRIVSGIN